MASERDPMYRWMIRQETGLTLEEWLADLYGHRTNAGNHRDWLVSNVCVCGRYEVWGWSSKYDDAERILLEVMRDYDATDVGGG